MHRDQSLTLEVPVQMFGLRMMTLMVLLGLYRLSPVLGMTALAIGTGYVVGRQRVVRASSRA